MRPSKEICIPYTAGLENFRGLSKDRVALVKECFLARQTPIFKTLGLLTASGIPNNKFFNDFRHLLGRLGEHVKAAKTLVYTARIFPAMFDDFQIQVQISPPSRSSDRSARGIEIDGLAASIFSKPDEIDHYQQALEKFPITSGGELLERLRDECCFKTRVHAELLLVDLFYWKQYDFVDDDPYIGCSKPACFNCFQYILAHPGNFTLPACHNKIYMTWRPPDILKDNALNESACKIRNHIVEKMSSNIRKELREQIDRRCSPKARQFDSVTGTSSSINSTRFRILMERSPGRSESSNRK